MIRHHRPECRTNNEPQNHLKSLPNSRLTILKKVLHVVVVPEALEDENVRRVLEDDSEFQSDADFVPVILQLSEADAAMQMRMAEATLSLGDLPANGLSLLPWPSANRLQNLGMNAYRLQANAWALNLPLNSV